MDEFLRYAKKIVMRIVLFPLRMIPIRKNRVLFHNDLARNYSDSPKFVAEYLRSHYEGQFDLIFSVKDPQANAFLLERGIQPVKFNSFRYFLSAISAQVLVTNSGGFSYVPLRKKQYVVNTWHGGGAYKKCGIYMYNNTPLFRRNLRLAGDATDAFLSTCSRFTDVISESMLVPKTAFWEIGMPRNDMMIHPNATVREEVRQKLGLKENEKILLFAPTYRKIDDNYFKDSIAISYGVDSERVCKAMEKRFGGKWRFAFRFHPCVTNRDELPQGDYMDLSDYPDMQELLCAADAMLNDFSSSMWDFMLTGRPSFLFAVDLEHYVKTTQVYTPVSEWPFPKAVNNDELEKNILEFDEQAYRAACECHYKALGGCETGQATQLVCERIFEQCFGTNA